jgi:uncharacterized protein (DUF927 family)
MNKFAPLSGEEIDKAVIIAPAAQDDAERRAKAVALVKECAPVTGTAAASYLAARGIQPANLPVGCVGWHGPSKAMLAIGRNAEGEISCVQRLFFDSAGNPVLESGKKKRRTNGVLKGAALTIHGAGAPIVCEGTEDALSLHLATGRPVYATFGTSNLGDAPAAAGASLTIVADNDAPGELAAHKAALRLTARGCAVSIATPEGVKDANAVLTTSGAEAVRDMVAAARPFEAHKRDNVESSGSQYISCGDYHMDSKEGLTIEVEKGRGKDKTIETLWIAQPFEVLGACRDTRGAGWGKWLSWRDPDGHEHRRHVSEAALQGDPASLCGPVADEGLRLNRDAQRHLLTYLSRVTPKGRVTMVSRTGWHSVGGRNVFVLPGQVIGPHASENVILDAAAVGPYEARGTLEEWQAGVGALVADHALGVLTISTALAGPLLHLAGQEGGGLNFFGASSKGKTTILQAGASAWGRGGSPGYVRAWRATANGLEGAAASATDTCLVLDELGVVEARDAAAAVYGLSNGSGKARAARDGSLREPKSWRVLTISTGEFPLTVKLAEDRGRRARAGQMVRLLDIPADRGLGFGAFDSAGPEGDAGKFSKAIKVAAVSAYGTAGPEFVRRLIAEGVGGETVRAMVGEFVAAEIPAGSDGQIGRAAERLGLIAAAGELATALGVTPWPPGAAMAAAAWALARWIEGRGGTEPAEVRQAIEAARLAIEQHGESRFEPLDGDGGWRPMGSRLGWRTGEGAERQWLIPAEVWKSEICAGLDPKAVARILGDRGMLERANDGWQAVRRIDGRSTRVYVLLPTILEGSGYGD